MAYGREKTSEGISEGVTLLGLILELCLGSRTSSNVRPIIKRLKSSVSEAARTKVKFRATINTWCQITRDNTHTLRGKKFNTEDCQ